MFPDKATSITDEGMIRLIYLLSASLVTVFPGIGKLSARSPGTSFSRSEDVSTRVRAGPLIFFEVVERSRSCICT